MHKTHEELAEGAAAEYLKSDLVSPSRLERIIRSAITAAAQAEREQMLRSFQMIVLGIVIRADRADISGPVCLTGPQIQELAETELARLSLNETDGEVSEKA